MTDPAIPVLIRQKIRERNGTFMHKLVPDWEAAYIELAEECGHSFWLSARFIAWASAAEKEAVLHAAVSVLVTKPADMDEADESVWKYIRFQATAFWLSYVDTRNFRQFAHNRLEAFERQIKEAENYAH